jgi:hypothetical protein
MLALVTRLHASLLIALMLTACSKDSASGADAKGESPSGQTTNSPEVSGPAAAPDGTSLGQIAATDRINLNAIINKSPEDVDAILGEPKHTGSDRISCVRFVPERVFFACEQEIHVYDHPEFEQIRVEFEDGKAAVVAVSGLPGEGAFSPEAALELVGVTVPGTPFHDNPALGDGQAGDVVDRWEWSNANARLLIDDMQHRVRLSVVNGEWKRAKVEIINNNPLDEDQQTRIKLPRGSEAPASTGE